MATFLLNGLGLSQGAKLVSTNDRYLTFSIIFRLVPRGDEKKCAAFCTIRLDVLQGRSVEIFAQKNENLTCLSSTLSRIVAKKLDPTLKPSPLKEITDLTHFYAHKSKCPRRF